MLLAPITLQTSTRVVGLRSGGASFIDSCARDEIAAAGLAPTQSKKGVGADSQHRLTRRAMCHIPETRCAIWTVHGRPPGEEGQSLS